MNNTVGIIDSDYYYSDNEGHIFVKITNDSNENKAVYISAGTAFVQGIFVEYGITIDDNVATCKKFYRDDNNHCIILQPANPEYTPIVINQESQAGFRVIGKLTLVINKR